MLKTKLQYLGHLMRRTNSLEKPWYWKQLKAGGEGDDRGQDGWMASLTQRTSVWSTFRRWWRTGKPGILQSMRSQNQTQLGDWTTTVYCGTRRSSVLHYLLEFVQIHLHWIGDAIQLSHPLLPSSPFVFNLSQHQRSFPLSQLFTSSGQSIGVSASASVLPMNSQGWFPLGLIGSISLQFKGLSRVFFSITVSKHQCFGAQTSLWSSSHPYTLLEKL